MAGQKKIKNFMVHVSYKGDDVIVRALGTEGHGENLNDAILNWAEELGGGSSFTSGMMFGLKVVEMFKTQIQKQIDDGTLDDLLKDAPSGEER